jgi:hypothetical protein
MNVRPGLREGRASRFHNKLERKRLDQIKRKHEQTIEIIQDPTTSRSEQMWLMMIRATGTLIDMNVDLIALFVMRKAESERFEAEMDSSLQLLVPIPLVEGRSFFSEQNCDPLVRELQKNRALLEHGVDTSMLKTFVVMGENCQRRRAHEKQLGQEHDGHASNAVVMIPSPGVPRDFPIEDDHDDYYSFQNILQMNFKVMLKCKIGQIVYGRSSRGIRGTNESVMLLPRASILTSSYSLQVIRSSLSNSTR